jgi:hypothetical protein
VQPGAGFRTSHFLARSGVDEHGVLKEMKLSKTIRSVKWYALIQRKLVPSLRVNCLCVVSYLVLE